MDIGFIQFLIIWTISRLGFSSLWLVCFSGSYI